MQSTIKDILDRYDETGGPTTDEDRNDLREYLVDKLMHTGTPVDEAYKIVQAFYWSTWHEGWALGYDGAVSHYGPKR